MQISVSNFRAIAKAVINTGSVTFITGDNEAGKTSFLQACRAATSGMTMPFRELTKAFASRLVHSGGAVGEVSCSTEEGCSKITYPDMTKTITGKPVEISDLASGFGSILDMDLRTRATAIAALLKTNPTHEDLVAVFKASGVTDAKLIEKIWSTAQALGWDAAHKHAIETGTKNKGLWEAETGERFGSEKVKSWLPAAWEPDLAMAKREDLAGALQQEQEWLDVAKQAKAVDASETARLQAEAGKFPVLREQVEEKEAVVGNALKAKTDLQRILGNLPPSKQPETIPCPHCGDPLAIESGTIVVPTLLTADELQARQQRISDTQESIKNAQKEIDDRTAELVGLSAQLQTAIAADQKLKAAAASPSAATKGTVEDLAAKVAAAQARLTAFDSYDRARTYATLIETGAKIVSILSPDGLRLETLQKRLAGFNTTLKNICDVAGWALVEIKDDLSVWYRGAPYLLISTAAQFKVRVVLQVACARIDGSPLVLVDAADVLASNENRMALIRLLLSSKISAIVAMSFGSKEKVPRLSKIGGRSYWFQNGVAEELV